MIVDARVLQPEFVPADVVQRDAEANALTGALDPVTRGERAEAAVVFGPSGTGKTCLSRYTVERLREEVIDINAQYVNCWEDYSDFRTLYRILDGIGETFDIHRQSTPRDELLDRIRGYDGPPYVVILDEVDQLEDFGLLYELHRRSNVALILIANSERELFARFDGRLTSRFQTATRIRFDRYATEELVAILESRVRSGLREDAINTRQLRTIADEAAGDARVAIGTLRAAAREARQCGDDRITDAIVSEAAPEAKSEIRRKNVEKLNRDQQVLYEIISDRGEVRPGDLYEAYCDRAEEPKTRRMVRNYLQKMCHYNLVSATGENRGRWYEPAD